MQKHAGKVPVLKQVLEDIQHLGMQQRRCGVLSCRCGAGKHKNSRADDRADTKRRERPRAQGFRQTMPRPFRVRDQLVNGLLGEELAGQKGLLKTEIKNCRAEVCSRPSLCSRDVAVLRLYVQVSARSAVMPASNAF